MALRIVFLSLTIALAGCASLPNMGPKTSDVIAQQVIAAPDQSLFSRYMIFDINPQVIDILEHRTPGSFIGRFGDYRPSVEPHIGIGDFVTVTVWEAATGGLFSSAVVADRYNTGSKSATIPVQAVARDGSITIPYAGHIHVVGDTTHIAEHKIEDALIGKAIEPQVLVNITKPVSNTVTVTGEVATGARIPLSVKGDRLLDVIAEAGGVRAPVHETFVQLSRSGVTASVPLKKVTLDPREDIFMRPGDVVTLVRDPQVFIAYGATGKNDEIPFDPQGIMLSQALAKVGGLLDDKADAAGVFIFRYEPDYIARALQPDNPLVQPGRQTPVVYRLDLHDANNLFLSEHFPIFNKDVLYVSNAPVSNIQKALALFNLVVSPVYTGASLATAFK